MSCLVPPAGHDRNAEVIYRDADNYKATRAVVLAGSAAAEDIAAIAAALSDGEWFIPSQVGLDDLQGELQQYDTDLVLDADGRNAADHPWHQLNLPDAVQPTDATPDAPMTWKELVEAFRTVAWNETDPQPPA